MEIFKSLNMLGQSSLSPFLTLLLLLLSVYLDHNNIATGNNDKVLFLFVTNIVVCIF